MALSGNGASGSFGFRRGLFGVLAFGCCALQKNLAGETALTGSAGAGRPGRGLRPARPASLVGSTPLSRAPCLHPAAGRSECDSVAAGSVGLALRGGFF